MHQIVEGLKFMHRHNVVHCDLKPDNILVRADSSVCIADFGNCYQVGSIIWRPGTLYYWPFGGLNNAGTTKIDLYSLTVVICGWFFGKAIPARLFDFKDETVNVPDPRVEFKDDTVDVVPMVYRMQQLKSAEVLDQIKSTRYQPKSAVLEVLSNLMSADCDISKISVILSKSFRLSHGLRIGHIVEKQYKKFADAKAHIKGNSEKKVHQLKKTNLELNKKIQNVTEECAAMVKSKDKVIEEFHNEIAELKKTLQKIQRKKEKKKIKHNSKHGKKQEEQTEEQSQKQTEEQTDEEQTEDDSSSKKKGRRVVYEVECIPELLETEQIVKGRTFIICNYSRYASQAEKKVVMEVKDGQKLVYCWVSGFREERRYVKKGNAICNCCLEICLNSQGYVSIGKKAHEPNCSFVVEEE